MDRKELVAKVCDKYGLLDNGLITSYVIGLMNHNNSQKIYRRFISIKNQKKSLVKIEMKEMRRKMNDIFYVKKIVFTVNSVDYKMERIFRYLKNCEISISESSITDFIKISRILNYTPVVSIISTSENEEKIIVHKAKFEQRKDYLIEFKILNLV